MRKKEIITEIEFFPIIPTKGLVCFISFTYNNSIRISDCAILTRPQGGYRLSYPIKTLKNGKTVQSVYPINNKIGKQIENILILNYENFLVNKVKL